MNSKSAGIYLILSKTNGKRYVGSSIRICDRWGRHLSELRANKHHSQHLQNHFNKYGEQDLIFTVLEVVERGELNLNDFKELLLSREQAYLDNWEECQFNSRPIAGSNLGHKIQGSKYYTYANGSYNVYYTVNGYNYSFSNHYTEEEAIREVEYLKTLTNEELIEYEKQCRAKPKRLYKVEGSKYYSFNKASKMYLVTYRIEGKPVKFSNHYTEEEAIKEVEYLKTLTDDELLKYKQECMNRPIKTKRNAKHYSFVKLSNNWKVKFRSKFYGYFATEQEAIDKVNELKQELNIKQGV
jgi:group I intron endonuclease